MTDKKEDLTWDYMLDGVEHENLLLKTGKVCEMLGIAKTTLDHMRLKGEGPRFVRVGERSVRYRLSDIYEWMGSQPSYGSTSEATTKKKRAPE